MVDELSRIQAPFKAHRGDSGQNEGLYRAETSTLAACRHIDGDDYGCEADETQLGRIVGDVTVVLRGNGGKRRGRRA